jgi:AcrR family transcriptional regulator
VNVVNLELVQHYGLMASTISGRGVGQRGTTPSSPRGQHRSQQRNSYHHGDLPNALTDAATEMAREGGPDAVVLRAAARATGVSAAAAYRHFADHGELLHAVRMRALTALADAMRASLEAKEPLADPAQESIRRLRALGTAYLDFALNDPGLFRTAFCRPQDPPMPESSKLAENGPFALVSGALDDLVENGVLAPHRRPGAEVAAWAAVHGLATLLLDGPLALLSEEERADARAKTSEFVLAGIIGREV